MIQFGAAAIALVLASSAGVSIAPDSVPDAYSYLYRGVTAIDGNLWKAVQDALPYESIQYRVADGIVEATGSESRPHEHFVEAVRTITLHRSGAAHFSGRDVNREGEFCSELSIFEYGRLCYALEEAGFFAMKPRYQSPLIAMGTREWTVTDVAGREYKVSEYGNFGPPTLWLLAHTMEALVETIAWRECD